MVEEVERILLEEVVHRILVVVGKTLLLFGSWAKEKIGRWIKVLFARRKGEWLVRSLYLL